MRLKDKVALVTGAGRGIGRAIALTFAREGAHVVVNYFHSEAMAKATVEEAGAFGVQALALCADVSKREEVQNMVKKVLDKFGRVDILVNNAAIFSTAGLFDVTEELWDEIFDINLKGVFLCSQGVGRAMLERGSGNIINIASGGGLSPRPGYEVSVAYAASKAGVIMLTKRLAVELGPKVRVNAVAPGIIDSKPEGMNESAKHRLSEPALLKRVGDSDDIARAALFLASDEGGFITGQILNVDGGIILH